MSWWLNLLSTCGYLLHNRWKASSVIWMLHVSIIDLNLWKFSFPLCALS